MSDHNASCAQYHCAPTPTPTWPVVTPTPGPLPHTGMDLGAEVGLGLVVAAIGACGLVFTSEWVRARSRRV